MLGSVEEVLVVHRVKSLKHAKNEVRFERVFIKLTKIFAKVTREAPGFFALSTSSGLDLRAGA